ncbi:fluoride efflux transporter FluC [Halococcoides cellulosivorans]|uniref:Fluoride-specific ion channel FluC n=1 Tax=Halococcoides cellulosivorans TaxID=1679096 RepID=A0A2R4X2L5_9EURY|nr:CrcB family protein [Halococcoides cellulosivorans]AWB28025.1 camphor resistance protein CrcB [Halococcoides cellulosivorans]
MNTLLVGLGGVAGAMARHSVGDRLDSTRDTLAVNLLGSLALGVLVATDPSASTLALLGTGFCGAFTTFSSFAFEVVRIAQDGAPRRAAGLATLHLAGAITAVAVGGGVVTLL